MKILHVSTIIEWRGGDNQMLTTYHILKTHRDLEQIIFCAKDSVLEKKCLEQNISFYSASRKSKYSLKFLTELIKVIRKEKINVLHVHDSKAFTLSLLAVKFFPKLRFVYSRKRNNKVHKNFFKVRKYNSPRIDKIICVSEAVKEVLKPVLKDESKVKVIYDGIEVEKFSKFRNTGILHRDYNLPPDTLIVGNIAGLTKQKDLFTFLEAAEIILQNTQKPVRFVIVGQGPLEQELKSRSTQLGISDQVIFAGFRNDIPEILPEFDVFMLSSDTEGLPLSIMEAFAAGVPVAATAAGGTGEAVKDEITGMISPVKQPESLAHNVIRLLEEEELREKVKKNALELVQRKFNLTVMEREYYEFYKGLEKA